MLDAGMEDTDAPQTAVVAVVKKPVAAVPPPKVWSTDEIALQPAVLKPRPTATASASAAEAKTAPVTVTKVVKPTPKPTTAEPMETTRRSVSPKPLKKKTVSAVATETATAPVKRKVVSEDEKEEAPKPKARKLNGSAPSPSTGVWPPKPEAIAKMKELLEPHGPFDEPTPAQLFDKVVNAPSVTALAKTLPRSELVLMANAWRAVTGEMDTFDLRQKRTATAQIVHVLDAQALREIDEIVAAYRKRV